MALTSLVTIFGALILISGALAGKQFPTEYYNVTVHVKDRSAKNEDFIVRKQASINCQRRHFYYDTLKCDTDYTRAVEDAIEESTCKNSFYAIIGGRDANDSCDDPIDRRENIDYCTDECAYRQYYYYYCTYLGEKRSTINEECDVDYDYTLSLCQFLGGDFCFLKDSLRLTVDTVCDDYDTCTKHCYDVVKQFKEESGCCVNYYVNHDYYLSKTFNACNFDIPEPCPSFSPPRELLDCTGINTATIAAPVFTTTMFITVISIMLDAARSLPCTELTVVAGLVLLCTGATH